MKSSVKIIIAVLLVLLSAIAVYGYFYNFLAEKNDKGNGGLIACTMEAKLCPDGSAVGRTGPNCEFAECPQTTVGEKQSTGYLTGHVDIGPFCPVEREDEPCKVLDEAYTSRRAIVYGLDKLTIKDQTNLDKNGNFKFTLSEGKYFVEISPAGIGRGELKPVTIRANSTTTITFDIDTGIR